MALSNPHIRKAYVNYIYAYLKKHKSLINNRDVDELIKVKNGFSAFFKDGSTHKGIYKAFSEGTAPRDVTFNTIENKFGLPISYYQFLQGFNKGDDTYTVFVHRSYDILENNPLLQTLPRNHTIQNELPQDIFSTLRTGSQLFFNELKGVEGLFQNLKINDLLLPHVVSQKSKNDLATNDSPSNTLLHYLTNTWHSDSLQHIQLLGEGGVGKTVSLINLWDTLLSNNYPQIVPIYIPLNAINEFYGNEEPLFRYILKNYFQEYESSVETKNIIWEFLKKPHRVNKHSKFFRKPNRIKVLVILDGFNELASLKTVIVNEIKYWLGKAQSCQFVISSRSDLRQNYNVFKDFHACNLLPIRTENVKKYLVEQGVNASISLELMEVVQNPLMLTIYTSTCEELKKNKSDEYIDFKENATTQGEVLWNYLQVQLLKFDNISEFYTLKFILFHFLPFISYRLEREGKLLISKPEFKLLVDEAKSVFLVPEFQNTYTEYFDYYEALGFGSPSYEQYLFLQETIFTKTGLLIKDKHQLQFLHQKYRDFFSSLHIINQINTYTNGTSLLTLNEIQSFWSHQTRLFISQIVGEHLVSPNNGFLIKLLENTRNIFDRDTLGYQLLNIINTWRDLDKNLSEVDFSCLNLSRINFNNLTLSVKTNGEQRSACFDGSIISEDSFFPQGHCSYIKCLYFNKDGTKLLSGGEDGMIKIWDTNTGQCLDTFFNDDRVLAVAFNSDETKIISASSKEFIKEWDIKTKGFTIKQSRFNYIDYTWEEEDGVKALFYTQNWETLTYDESYFDTFVAVLSPDNSKALIEGEDQNGEYQIQEVGVESGDILNTFEGSFRSIAYNPFGNKIAIGSNDGITMWDLITNECIFHSPSFDRYYFYSYYANEGKTIICGTMDTQIEWDVESGKFIQYSESINDLGEEASSTKVVIEFNDDFTKINSLGGLPVNLWKDKYEGNSIFFVSDRENYTTASINKEKSKLVCCIPYYAITEWDLNTGLSLRTFRGFSGLMIEGCSFSSLHPDSTISEKQKSILKSYGGVFDS